MDKCCDSLGKVVSVTICPLDEDGNYDIKNGVTIPADKLEENNIKVLGFETAQPINRSITFTIPPPK